MVVVLVMVVALVMVVVLVVAVIRVVVLVASKQSFLTDMTRVSQRPHLQNHAGGIGDCVGGGGGDDGGDDVVSVGDGGRSEPLKQLHGFSDVYDLIWW